MKVAVVFDHTALSGLGAGTRFLSRMVDRAHYEPNRYVYAPALCLVAAVADRRGLADHVGALPALEVLDLGYAAASAVGELVAAEVDWRLAHAVQAATPNAEWPQGLPVVTGAPDLYAPWRVATIPFSP
ncbi:MAG TPA: hypothetical protein VGR21_06195 [Cryptosporangiaceae bacterium]|nr:hypothetical protein [Cryptosporangiaceae bacterium]